MRSAVVVHNHPAPLARTWVDATASTPADTVEWMLTRDGEDQSRHRRVDTTLGDSAQARVVAGPTLHYGLWFVQGELADTLGRRLCFIPRPGRSRSFCQRFDLDSTSEGAHVVRRLVVHADAGVAHRVVGHVLLSEDP